MAYFRDKSEERTGYQIGEFCRDTIDNQCDFVMCYRTDESIDARIKDYRSKGYVIHHMTGISWGHYIDYLNGDYDGRNHWDEAQTDRYGNKILHSVDTPYMVPTISFTDYLCEKLKKVVDCGVEAIHVEEPEFWDRAGYSEAFKREYELYYREKWTPPHESLTARYRCSKLKQYLYTRAIDRISSSLKEYAAVKYNRVLRFYVPTHSLLNYTQWKIVSPEGKLADIPGVDGCIAQVWTGTSREKNWFNGEFKERTFETAFFEYGVMQELVKNTGRHMWFLHDPIEDNPIFDWNDYRKNYLCTVTASLLHPGVNTYEICPWPGRVFEGKYPKNSPDAVGISEEYNTILNNMFNTLGTFEACNSNGIKVGILCGDAQLYQREYPDSEFSEKAKEEVGTVLHETDDEIAKIKNELFNAKTNDKELMLKYLSSNSFPAFYGLAMPLLKYGVPIRPVLIDNARRYNGYLDDYDVLLLSYEYMKPEYPDMNTTIAQWVKNGGTLIYCGDGFDPYHKINSWWNGKYKDASEHLMELLDFNGNNNKEIFRSGKGVCGYLGINPSSFLFSENNADILRNFYTEVLTESGKDVVFKNNLVVERDNYIVAAVMDEGINNDSLVLKGNYVDMYSADFVVKKTVELKPGENALLYNLDKISNKNPQVIGTSVRLSNYEYDGETVRMNIHGTSPLHANIRIYCADTVIGADIDGDTVACEYDSDSKTALISFESKAEDRVLTIRLERH